jgi:hypothetical protein
LYSKNKSDRRIKMFKLQELESIFSFFCVESSAGLGKGGPVAPEEGAVGVAAQRLVHEQRLALYTAETGLHYLP